MKTIDQVEQEAFREYFGRMNKRQLFVILIVFASFILMASGFFMLVSQRVTCVEHVTIDGKRECMIIQYNGTEYATPYAPSFCQSLRESR